MACPFGELHGNTSDSKLDPTPRHSCLLGDHLGLTGDQRALFSQTVVAVGEFGVMFSSRASLACVPTQIPWVLMLLFL